MIKKSFDWSENRKVDNYHYICFSPPRLFSPSKYSYHADTIEYNINNHEKIKME